MAQTWSLHIIRPRRCAILQWCCSTQKVHQGLSKLETMVWQQGAVLLRARNAAFRSGDRLAYRKKEMELRKGSQQAKNRTGTLLTTTHIKCGKDQNHNRLQRQQPADQPQPHSAQQPKQNCAKKPLHTLTHLATVSWLSSISWSSSPSASSCNIRWATPWGGSRSTKGPVQITWREWSCVRISWLEFFCTSSLRIALVPGWLKSFHIMPVQIKTCYPLPLWLPPCCTNSSNHEVFQEDCSKAHQGHRPNDTLQTSVCLLGEQINKGRSLTGTAHDPDSPKASQHLLQDAISDFISAFNTVIPDNLILELHNIGLAAPHTSGSKNFSTTGLKWGRELGTARHPP